MSMFSQSLIQGLINPSYADALGTAGMLAGSMPDRLRLEREEREKKMREAQIASMEATATGATEEAARKRAMAQQVLTGQVASAQDPGVAAAAQAGAMRSGVKPTDVKAAAGMATERTEKTKRQQGIETVTQIASRSDVNNPNVQRAIQQVALNYGLTKEDLAMVLPASGMEGKDRYLSVGGSVLDMLNGTWKTPPNEAEVASMEAKDIAKLYEKFTPSSVQEFIKDPSKPLDIIADAPKTSSEMTAEQKTAKLLVNDNTLEVIDNVIKRADSVWAGTYPLAKNTPMTSAIALETDLASVKASLAFDRLQKMRDESKTGGALGQVSNIELKLLESAVAGLNPAAPNFKENLERVRRSYDDFSRSVLGLLPSSDKYMQVGGNVYYKKGDEWFDLGAIE